MAIEMQRVVQGRMEPGRTVREILAECLAATSGAHAFVTALRPRGGRAALAVVAGLSADGSPSPSLPGSTRLAARSAVDAGRTVLNVHQRRAGKLRTYTPEAVIAVPIALREPETWGALVVVGEVARPYGAAVRRLEALAGELALLLRPDARPLDAPRDPDPDLPCGMSQDVLLHELRTPLGAAGFALEALGRRDDAPWDRHDEQMVQIARLGVLEAQSIVRWYSQLREADGAESGPRLGVVGVREVIDRAVALLPTVAPRVRVVAADDLAPVAADALWLVQALANLLENAAKHSPAHAEIVVAAQRVSDERVLISVKDRGAGIRDDQRQAIFHPYVRASASDDLTSRGLGLSIARHFITAMGGAIWVETDGCESTTFLITLPAARGGETAQHVAPARPDVRQSAE
jgi:signal transduction histidine kinase